MSHILAQTKLGVEVKSIIIKASIAIVGIFLLLWLLDDTQTTEQSDSTKTTKRVVSVFAVTPASETPMITQSGIAKPRWKVDVISTVSGKTKQHFDSVLPGRFVKAGQVIAQLDDTVYLAQVAAESARVAQAKLNLARYQHEQTAAIKIENGNAQNDFRLFIPHIEAAKSELNAAIASHRSAQQRLDETKVIAPFDAIILNKFISPEQQVNAGDVVYQLAASNVLDVEVFLSTDQWQRILPSQETTATIRTGSGLSWQANVRYLSASLDEQTRQRHLHLSIENPYEGGIHLLPEQQVLVSFLGQPIANAVSLPATVLTRDNQVWVVENGVLISEQVQLITENDDTVSLQFVNHPSKHRQVVAYPLSTMIEGQQVQSQIMTMEEL